MIGALGRKGTLQKSNTLASMSAQDAIGAFARMQQVMLRWINRLICDESPLVQGKSGDWWQPSDGQFTQWIGGPFTRDSQALMPSAPFSPVQLKAEKEAASRGLEGLQIDEETPMPKPVHCIKDSEMRVYLQNQFQVFRC
jgi:hypothetical protein